VGERTVKAYFVETKDLSVTPLQLLELVHVVPEAALGNNLIGGKNSHSVDGCSLTLGLGLTAAHNLIFVHRLR
jgi:hypothetical protein